MESDLQVKAFRIYLYYRGKMIPALEGRTSPFTLYKFRESREAMGDVAVVDQESLVVVNSASSTAMSEYNDNMRISRKRGAEAMEDYYVSRKRSAWATKASTGTAPDVVELHCFVVGIGEVLGIQIASNAKLIRLQESIKSKRSQQLKNVVAQDLHLFLAKKADNTWLSADPAFEESRLNMLSGCVPNATDAIITDKRKLLNGRSTIAEVLGSTSLPSNYLHLIVKAPLPTWTIRNTAVVEYQRIADDLKESEEVKAVVKTLETVRKREKGSMPFVVLENSSGTGKTQMAFNLIAHGAFDVYYLPCTPSQDLGQVIYEAFDSRQHAFTECLESDIADMNRGSSAFDGSIGDFKSISVMKRLKVYAFIIAALRGDNTFMGDALLEDVREIRDQRSKPIVFFLDEFSRGGDQLTGAALDARTALVRSMRNVFRFLRLPFIVSATNGTARGVVSVSTYSRPFSVDPVP